MYLLISKVVLEYFSYVDFNIVKFNNCFLQFVKITIKQHYVPQFYLKNFSNLLYGLDKKENKIFKTNSKNIAFEPEFYGPDIQDKPSMEKTFADMEKNWSIAIKKLIETENFLSLSDELKRHVVTCMTFQLLRTKQFRKDIAGMANSIMGIFLESKGLEKDAVKLSREGEIKQHLNMLKDYPAFATIISQMKFCVVSNKTPIPLWTSDNPINLQNDLPPEPPFSNMGLACRGIEIHFPLNPKLSLVALDPTTFHDAPNHYEVYAKRLIHRENYHQFLNSSRFLFSNTRKFHERKKMLSLNPDVCDPEFVRFSMGWGSKQVKTMPKTTQNSHIYARTTPNRKQSSVIDTWMNLDDVDKLFKMNKTESDNK